MQEKIYNFMRGRYGNDTLNKTLMGVSLVCFVLSFFFRSPFYWLGLLFLVVTYVRMLSRNIYKRSAENEWYLDKLDRVKGFFKRGNSRVHRNMAYHVYKCPSCSQKVRIPRGKGKVEISCPKCGSQFVKRS